MRKDSLFRHHLMEIVSFGLALDSHYSAHLEIGQQAATGHALAGTMAQRSPFWSLSQKQGLNSEITCSLSMSFLFRALTIYSMDNYTGIRRKSTWTH